MGVRWFWVAACTTIALAVSIPTSASALYRARVIAEANDVMRRVAQGHHGSQLESVISSRFGEPVTSLEPSLARDISAWRYGAPGAENRDWRHKPAYYLVGVSLQRGLARFSHVFIWSPRQGRFVHFQNWGGCREVHCPYRFDPRCGEIDPNAEAVVCESGPPVIIPHR